MNPLNPEVLIATLALGLHAAASHEPCPLAPSPSPSGGNTLSDPSGALGQTQAPVSLSVHLNKRQLRAAHQGRLGWREILENRNRGMVVPVQWAGVAGKTEPQATWLIPTGTAGTRRFEWVICPTPFANNMGASSDPNGGQVEVTDAGRPVLRYNYRTVQPGPVLDQVSEGNRIYARARSDYIHPLYGPNGESLTRDWPQDHPHHRGIYWAWPEVEFGKERGDLHALQHVFARPTGRLRLQNGPVFAQVDAENLWLWEDQKPIVREHVVIRVYRASARGRVVDLRFQFVGLEEGVTIARRDRTHYGGLSLRLATPHAQQVTAHSDPPGCVPRRAWSDLSGIFAGTQLSGLSVLQSGRNPQYPGEWVQYPDLAWCQPTFPAPGTRHLLPQGQPLVLRYRLWIHPDATPEDAWAAELWDAWHSPSSASCDSPSLADWRGDAQNTALAAGGSRAVHACSQRPLRVRVHARPLEGSSQDLRPSTGLQRHDRGAQEPRDRAPLIPKPFDSRRLAGLVRATLDR